MFHNRNYARKCSCGLRQKKCVSGLLNLIVSLINNPSIQLSTIRICLGPVKNPTTTTSTVLLSTSSIAQRATYPASYILTEAPHPLSSSIICPPTKSWRVPDPYDCTIYHDCYHGTDLISYCPAQFQYNPEKQKCDYAQNVQCRDYLRITSSIISCFFFLFSSGYR